MSQSTATDNLATRSLDELLSNSVSAPATKADIQDLRNDIQALHEALLPRPSPILTGPAVLEAFRRLSLG